MGYKPKKMKRFLNWFRRRRDPDDINMDTLDDDNSKTLSDQQAQMTSRQKEEMIKREEIKRVDEQLSLWEDDVRDKMFVEQNSILS